MPAKPRDPIFVFDSHEDYLPLAVESAEAVPATLVKLDGSDGGKVKLDALPAEGGRMNFPPNPKRDEARMRKRFGNVGYRRELSGGGLTWVQYWLWYLYNPKLVVVTGDHEGDWEFVQVGYAGEEPVCVTASQHRSGGARMWWDVERRAGRPLIYPALGSHANFFEPVDQLPEVGDRSDGKGATLDKVEWRGFGPWATWPGLWGNSTGAGRSPQSPGSQGERWNAPHRYHSRAEYQL
ncbi:MAG TPA: hypothetical protein VFX85_06905 [Solirubrobacterales bacterium]|nr:hypothetical protein [Solirubrobacterales bacterium]